MFKSIVRPFQKVLLERKLCVGCTKSLTNAPKMGNLSNNRFMIQCHCRRRYVFDKELNQYQRATFAEEQQVLKQIEKSK